MVPRTRPLISLEIPFFSGTERWITFYYQTESKSRKLPPRKSSVSVVQLIIVELIGLSPLPTTVIYM